MATYTQITRNEDGEYIRETKESPTKTFYLVEYATVATYFKVKARDLDEAKWKMYDNHLSGVESVEHPDRFDIIVDETCDEGMLMDDAKNKQLRMAEYRKTGI